MFNQSPTAVRDIFAELLWPIAFIKWVIRTIAFVWRNNSMLWAVTAVLTSFGWLGGWMYAEDLYPSGHSLSQCFPMGVAWGIKTGLVVLTCGTLICGIVHTYKNPRIVQIRQNVYSLIAETLSVQIFVRKAETSPQQTKPEAVTLPIPRQLPEPKVDTFDFSTGRRPKFFKKLGRPDDRTERKSPHSS